MINEQADASKPGLEIDLFIYIEALMSGWKSIVFGSVLGGLLIAAYCSQLPNIFEAFVRVGVIDTNESGGIRPDERRASEVLTLVEHGFITSSSRDNFLAVTVARLRSRKFTAEFIGKHQIYQKLYPNQWEHGAEIWKPEFKFDQIGAFKHFSENIRLIEHNPENDIITLRMRWTDPEVAQQWANAYIDAFNHHMRQRTLDEVARKQAFLFAELKKSDIVDIQKSIYRLIEAQTAIAMLANSRDQFALEIIDPATIPSDRFSPAPKRLIAYGSLVGAALAITFILGRIFYTRFRKQLKTLQQFKMVNNETNMETHS